MKKILYFSFVAFFGLSACDNSGDSESRNLNGADSTAKDTITKENIKSYSESFQNLLKSTEGQIRGVSLGMSMPEVKKLEEGTQLEEEKTNQLDYMLNYAELEEAEVNYLFNEYGRVNTIEVNIYTKSPVSQDSIFGQFENHFKKKYGDPISADSNLKKWQYKPDNLQILLEKRGNKKIHDINVRFTGLMSNS